jgi:hypothetical protein
MGIYTEAVQKLYVAYFSRPADPAGLAYWEGVVAANPTHSTAAVSAAFAASAEYKAAYAGLTETQIVNTIYNNLFGRDAEPAGLLYWAAALQAKTITVDNMVATIANAAQSTDATAYANKVAAATAFTLALDTTAEILGYNGTSANAAAKVFLAGITTTASLDAALVPAAMDAAVLKVTTPVPVDVNVALTTGVDNIVGTANNENIAGSTTTYTGLDKIDGGQGQDTLTLSDVTGDALLLSLASVKNVETLQFTSTKGLAGGAANVSGWDGLTSATFVTAATGATTITAAGTTAVTVSNSTDQAVTISGGNVDSVTTGNAAVVIGSNTLTKATVVGGNTVSITDNGKGTLTTVSLNGQAAAATITGAKVADLSLANSASNVTVTATAGARDLKVTVDKLTGGIISDTTASSITVDAKNNASTGIALVTDSAAAVTITGDKAVSFTSISDAGADTLVTLNKITSTNSAGVTITGTLNDGIAFTSGAGADSIVVGATTKAIVMGDGNDTVKVNGSALGSGGSIDAGAGTSDVLKMDSGSAAAASANGDFAGTVSGFERLQIDSGVAGGVTTTVNLANMDNINYVRASAGTTAGVVADPGVKEVTTFTVTGAASGADTIAFDGVTISTIRDGDSAATVASKIAAGTYTNYTVTASGAVLTVTNKVAGVAVDLTNAAFTVTDVNSAAIAATGVVVDTQGVTAVPAKGETQTLQLSGAATGHVAFLGVKNIAGSIATDDATSLGLKIIDDKAGIIAAWNAANPAKQLANITFNGVDTLTLEYTIAAGNVPNTALTVANGMTFAASVDLAGATAAVAAVAEVFTVAFSGPSGGADQIAFDGTTVTMADADTATQVAAKMAAATYANYTAAVGAVAGTVTFTKKVAEALTDITTAAYVVTNALTAGGAPAVGPATVTTQGVNPIVGSEGILALTNMASGGTLRTDATGSYNIGIKDASSGTADVANVLISSASAIATTIVAADVETINFTTTDTQTTGIVAHTDTLNLTASGAKTIVVTGNAGLTVTNNAANTKITSFDASGVTLYGDTSTDALKAVAETAAAVTFTSVAGASASVSIKGGAGADVLTGSAATDTIVGGAGNDTLNGMAGQDVLTGGAGNDIFVMSTLATSGVSYDTITDLTAGDIVRFGAALGNADANGSVAGNQLGAALSGLDAAVAVFQDYLDAAANKGANIVSWFQFGGNTYVVQDINGAQTFQNGADNVVKITGLVTLTNSTFTGTDLTIV